MPSSATDRFTVDFEYIFFFSKQGKYYFEQQFEAIKGNIEDYKKDKRKGTQNHQPNNRSHFQIGKTFMPQFKGRNKRTVWNVNTKPFKEAHFAVFPEALIETPILAGCPPKGIVLDIFMGSGTTGLVALKNNRRYVGIELNKEYIDMAEKRLSPYQNQKLDNYKI